MPTALWRVNAQNRRRKQHLAGHDAPQGQHVDRSRVRTYPSAMEQMQPQDELPSATGGSMSKAASVKDRVDDALSRLETMVEERLRGESARAEELAKRLSKLERQHDELKKVATEVEGRLERAMEYIRSLLAADQS
jgi:chromosome segregation ATPase